MEIDAITKAIHEHHNTMREQVVAGFIEKARSRTGRYANTSKNRKLGRVGALYTGRVKFPDPSQRRNSECRQDDTYIHTLTVGDGTEALVIGDDGVARNDFYENQKVEKYVKHYEKVKIGDKVRYAGRVRSVYSVKNIKEGDTEIQLIQLTGKPSYSGAPRGTGKWIPRKDVEKL